jgi:urease accessory protein UreE
MVKGKNWNAARFRAAKVQEKKERRIFYTKADSFEEIIFCVAGEDVVFRWDEERRCVYRVTTTYRYPLFDPEFAAFLYAEAEERFKAKWYALRKKQQTKRRQKKLATQREPVQLDLFEAGRKQT